MIEAQRDRMITRFNAKRAATAYGTGEHGVVACILTALLYGASVRTINSQSRRLRAYHHRRADVAYIVAIVRAAAEEQGR